MKISVTNYKLLLQLWTISMNKTLFNLIVTIFLRKSFNFCGMSVNIKRLQNIPLSFNIHIIFEQHIVISVFSLVQLTDLILLDPYLLVDLHVIWAVIRHYFHWFHEILPLLLRLVTWLSNRFITGLHYIGEIKNYWFD